MRTLEFILPQMPTLVEEPPDGDEWVHEIKYDGYRTQIIIESGVARAFTRNGHDWTDRYDSVCAAAAALSTSSAIIDGEVIVTGVEGKPDFGSLGQAIRQREGQLVFVAFDLLHVEGQDLRSQPLSERRRLLWQLVEPAEGRIQFSHHMTTRGKEFFAAIDQAGLEGMVSKRRDSRYRSGPSKSWLKIKCYQEADFELLGVLREPGNPPMALMATADAERRYVGSAFIALNKAMRQRLWERVQDAKGPPPKGIKPKPGAEWVKPGMIGRVRYLKGEEKLRHVTLKEVRGE
jgi:DNA ligase D-like protein (predicted ligase)